MLPGLKVEDIYSQALKAKTQVRKFSLQDQHSPVHPFETSDLLNYEVINL